MEKWEGGKTRPFWNGFKGSSRLVLLRDLQNYFETENVKNYLDEKI